MGQATGFAPVSGKILILAVSKFDDEEEWEDDEEWEEEDEEEWEDEGEDEVMIFEFDDEDDD